MKNCIRLLIIRHHEVLTWESTNFCFKYLIPFCFWELGLFSINFILHHWQRSLFQEWTERLVHPVHKSLCLPSLTTCNEDFTFFTSVWIRIDWVSCSIQQSRHPSFPTPPLWVVKSRNMAEWFVYTLREWDRVKQFTTSNAPDTSHGIFTSCKDSKKSHIDKLM